MMATNADFDVIVVGSGFGGAVLACRLAEHGQSVLVLERGREWKVEEYPRGPGDAWCWDDEDPARNNGWIDVRYFDDMVVVQGAAVGGGSQIYANVSVEAQPWVFETGWPTSISYDLLAPHYKTVGKMLNVQEVPNNQITRRFKLMQEAARKTGHHARFRKLPLAVSFSKSWQENPVNAFEEQCSEPFINEHDQQQGTCIHCGYCDIGCPVRAKNTLDLNYLAVARKHRAEIRPLHLVRNITPEGDNYRVYFESIRDDHLAPGSHSATRVVLAAGSLGSTELLLRARDEFKTLPKLSRRLGHRWSSNGDFLTPAFYPDQSLAPTRGPTISCAVDFLDGNWDGERFFVEDGGFPNVIGAAIESLAEAAGRRSRLMEEVLKSFRSLVGDSLSVDCIMPWFGQAADAADGRLRLKRPWWKPFGKRKLQLDWDITASKGAIEALIDAHKVFARATGGHAMEPVTWSLAKNLITPHPLGGCAMSDRPEDGVVDANGQVFGYPRLYVADGSVIPTALGLNPSRTIAALAEHIANVMLTQRTEAPS